LARGKWDSSGDRDTISEKRSTNFNLPSRRSRATPGVRGKRRGHAAFDLKLSNARGKRTANIVGSVFVAIRSATNADSGCAGMQLEQISTIANAPRTGQAKKHFGAGALEQMVDAYHYLEANQQIGEIVVAI
jgi:hypothetical protein